MNLYFKQVLTVKELQIHPIVLGTQPVSKPTPNIYVIIYKNNIPYKRFDIYDDEYYDFKHPFLFLTDWIVICFGNHIYWINTKSDKIINYDLMEYAPNFSYFMDIISHDDYIIITTGTSIIVFDKNTNFIWCGNNIAIDGINITKIEGNTIYCSCEMDPPGGWIDKIIKF